MTDQTSSLVGSPSFLRKSTKAVYNEASNKKLHRIIKDVAIDFSNRVMEKELVDDTEFKRYQRSIGPLPVLERLFKLEAEYGISINSQLKLANMHLKMEAKIDNNKLIQCFNCQK